MNFESMTDKAISAEIGKRIEQMRLERNLTQQQLADRVGLSRISYGKLESGQAKFVNVIAVLRALDSLDLVEKFIPETPFSPLERLKMQGKKRRRASGSRLEQADTDKLNDKALDW